MLDYIELINNGKLNCEFRQLYGNETERLEKQKRRYLHLIKRFNQEFPGECAIEIFSTPGRTEVGGRRLTGGRRV